MRQKTKSLSLVACVVLVLLSTVAGTLAYFTDADSAKNTFTIGKVGITLTEYSKKENNENIEVGTPNTEPGAEEGTVKITGYEYTLIPGLTYAKKPVVTVTEGSEDAYVRMMVTISNYDKMQAIFGENMEAGDFLKELASEWNLQQEAKVQDNAVTYEFRYKTIVDDKSGIKGDGELQALFTSIQLPGEVDNDQLAALQGMEVSVVAHAIQAAGFENADAAWAAFDTQHG